jgi:nicotinamidase-related amidase
MKNILVIVDAQNDFIDGALGSEDAKSRIPNICKKIENFTDGLIIMTRDTHKENYLETKEGSFLPVEHCIEYTRGWGINTKVSTSVVIKEASDPSVSYEAISKPTFGSTELMECIYNYVGDEEFNITFVGFCTDICVISNALLAKATFYEQSNIFVDASCCAGVTPEKHNAALEVMKSCQITVENE